MSLFPRPIASKLGNFKVIHLPAKRASEIIKQYCHPLYVTLDIEHLDQAILEEIFFAEIRPRFISAESHDIPVFCTLVAPGKYNSFKIIDGKSFVCRYKNHRIKTKHGIEQYSFPYHSAGPFGEDISGPWMTANQLFKLLKLGWTDIHATNIENPHSEFQTPYEIPLTVLIGSFPSSFHREFRNTCIKFIKAKPRE